MTPPRRGAAARRRSAVARAARAARAGLGGAGRRVRDELALSMRFIGNDLWTTVLPVLVFVLAAARHGELSPPATAWALLRGLFYGWLFIYGFALVNQLHGIAEDRLNKPFRPLVTNACTVAAARERAVVVLTVFPLVGWWFGVLPQALLWQVVHLAAALTGADRHWWVKNTVIGVGVFAQMTAAWGIAAPLEPVALLWAGVLAAVVLLLIPVQDLRDLPGDRAAGRRTLPMVIGERTARRALAAGFAVLPSVLSVVLVVGAEARAVAGAFAVAVTALSWWTAVRVLTRSGPEEDHRTQRRFEQLYVLALLAALVLL